MYNVIQSNDTLFATRQARAWKPMRGFCTLLVVSAVLCGLSGCGGETPGPSPAALEPGNDAQPSLVATASLTSTAPVTVPVAQTITDTVTDTVPAVTDTKVITPVTNEAIITHTVKAGDVLGTIASQYDTTAEAIKAVNGLTSDLIRLGQILTIPQTSAPAPVPSAAVTPTTTSPLPAPAPSTAAEIAPTPPASLSSNFLPGDWGNRVIYITASLVLLGTVLLFFVVWRRPSAQPVATAVVSHFSPAPAPTSAGLAGPPAAGTAYLETRLVATGATLYYPLTQTVITIGRDPSNSIAIDQRFPDPDAVSRQHIQIVRAGDTFIAKDLGAANGLLINNQRSRENVLRDGVVLGIGKTQFIFRLNQPGGTA